MIHLSANQTKAMLKMLSLIETRDMLNAGMTKHEITLVQESYIELKKQEKRYDNAA
ncbi:hypothetical protein [Catenovulum sediminis]|uniref:hypothetical protein n=1 Tax=Catenovulum sediminis TaxID=1740262 RepID=UPI00163DDAF7|nr:hypothetical protein [Catenovulum sediminis]